MALRAGHGNGAGVPRVETKPWDEQGRPSGEAAPLVTGRDPGGRVRTSEAARALAKLPRRFAFVPRKLACDARFEPHNRRRLDYLKRRRSEVCTAWGHVSHGVGAMLSAEAWLWSAGEMASELGAEKADAKQFATAANLYAQAKQLAAAAWELAERESKVRKDDPKLPPVGFEHVEEGAES
jgi:hypothetical protein